jgi:hypothetical protein
VGIGSGVVTALGLPVGSSPASHPSTGPGLITKTTPARPTSKIKTAKTETTRVRRLFRGPAAPDPADCPLKAEDGPPG